jgi:branched-chain amino acid transport system ATP-binding protein
MFDNVPGRGPIGSGGQPILQLESIVSHYGDALALSNISMEIRRGAIVSIVGANGAGKTTVLRVMSGVVRPTEGRLLVDGEHVRNPTTSDLVRRGIAHCPEGRRIFPYMSVHENIAIGAYTVRDRRLVEERFSFVYDTFPVLKERANQLGRNLSGGQQQMLAIARAYMSGPKVLLLDEPTLGLAPRIIHEVAELVRRMRERGLTVVMVEQNAEIALDIADYVYVMAHGRIQVAGSAAELRDSEVIRRVYLGL